MKSFKEFLEEKIKIDELKVGDVIKIVAKDYYNYWATIIDIKNNKYIVVPEGENNTIAIIKDDIKWPIGNRENDWSKLGDKRHKNEVVKEIDRVSKKFNIKI